MFSEKKKIVFAIVVLTGACGLTWLASSSFQSVASRLYPRLSHNKNRVSQTYQNASEGFSGEASAKANARYSRQNNPKSGRRNPPNSKQPGTVLTGESYDDMPELFTEKEIVVGLVQASAMEIWLAQDKHIRQWPKYEEVKGQLQSELSQTFDLKNMTAENLLTQGLKYRQTFWDNGGANSSGAFKNIFTARLLLEMAYGLEPTDIAVADELVETIQAAHPLVAFENGSPEKVRNVEVEKELWGIRLNQFNQIKEEISAGRKPNWGDFMRVVDLCVLGSHFDNKTATNVLDWLYQNSAQGGWEVCHPIFNQFSQALARGKNFNFNIYIPTKAEYPHEYRFGRRLPSFQGPNPQKRGITLWPKSQAENITSIKH